MSCATPKARDTWAPTGGVGGACRVVEAKYLGVVIGVEEYGVVCHKVPVRGLCQPCYVISIRVTVSL